MGELWELFSDLVDLSRCVLFVPPVPLSPLGLRGRAVLTDNLGEPTHYWMEAASFDPSLRTIVKVRRPIFLQLFRPTWISRVG